MADRPPSPSSGYASRAADLLDDISQWDLDRAGGTKAALEAIARELEAVRLETIEECCEAVWAEVAKNEPLSGERWVKGPTALAAIRNVGRALLSSSQEPKP